MNKLTKDLAMKTFDTVRSNTKIDPKNMEGWIDEYVLELTRNIVFKCSDIVREAAKNAEPELARSLKATAVDMLDEFGL
jgi:hypothetical protein